jgi:hypothetical protein
MTSGQQTRGVLLMEPWLTNVELTTTVQYSLWLTL